MTPEMYDQLFTSNNTDGENAIYKALKGSEGDVWCSYSFDYDSIKLDGNFTIKDLEKIIHVMKNGK